EMALRAESLDLKKPTVNTAISRVKALSSNPLIGERFDFVEELKKNRLIVLDCRYLTVEQTRLIAAAAARTLQRHGRTMAQRSLSVDATESEK
ncbi:hypothetical protein ABTF39_19755, partial [Acinetobacter baumannii]